MTTLLITGGAGFVGSYVLEALLAQGCYKLIVLVRSKTDLYRIEHLKNSLEIVDIDKITLQNIFEHYTIDGIIHLATHYSKIHTYDEIPSMIQTNITFGTLLADLAIKNNIRFFINTGTFFEYSVMNNPISEFSVKDPYNLYAATKIAMDAVLDFYVKESTAHVLTLKLAAPYGYKDNVKLISYLMKSLAEERSVVLEKGEQEWDFVYVKDVANAYVKAVEFCCRSKRPTREEIYIGNGKAYSIKNMVEFLNTLIKKPLIETTKPYVQDQIFVAYGDISKAKNLLQWVPQYSLEEGLKETYHYYKGC